MTEEEHWIYCRRYFVIRFEFKNNHFFAKEGIVGNQNKGNKALSEVY
jgi:hypothetical protein